MARRCAPQWQQKADGFSRAVFAFAARLGKLLLLMPLPALFFQPVTFRLCGPSLKSNKLLNDCARRMFASTHISGALVTSCWPASASCGILHSVSHLCDCAHMMHTRAFKTTAVSNARLIPLKASFAHGGRD